MKFFVKISILSISLLIIISGALVSPALGSIQDYFPLANDYTIKLLVTLPSMFIIPFSLISGKISDRVNKKVLVVLGLILYIVGGVGGAFVRDIYQLLASRAVIGIGMGILLPLIGSIISELYKGDEKVKMMGFSNATSNFGGILGTFFSGKLTLISWRYVFLLYLVAVISLTLVLIWMPSSKVVLNNKKIKREINSSVVKISIIAVLVNISFYSIMTNIALYMRAENLGRADSAGIAISTLTFAGFASGVLLHKLTYYFKKYTGVISLLLIGMGFVFVSRSYSLYILLIGVALIGFSMGILTPMFQLKVIECTPKSNNTYALSFLNGAIYLGKFASPIVLTTISNAIGWRTNRQMFMFLGVVIILGSALGLIKRLEVFKEKNVFNKI